MIKHYLTRALTPPHILIQKAAIKAKGYITKQYQRQHDKSHSTYSESIIKTLKIDLLYQIVSTNVGNYSRLHHYIDKKYLISMLSKHNQ